MKQTEFEKIHNTSGGKIGWPWTKEKGFELPNKQEKLPKISIVTPSLNQGKFLEETIRSVILQCYPNLEYFIIDGGSNDSSIDIIRKYSSTITDWISEPDEGQSHAINKGFLKASGEIFCYINSDDILEENALAFVANEFIRKKDAQLVIGRCVIFRESGIQRIFEPIWPKDLSYFLEPFGSPFAQPASFWTKDTHGKVGGFDPKLHYAFDREFFLKIGLSGAKPVIVEKALARYREHQDTKTANTVKFYEESIPVLKKYADLCGLSYKEVLKRLHKINNEIAYLQTFSQWKLHGRAAAIHFFVRHMLKSPDFLIERKVMGLARRLLMFSASDVEELRNV